MSHQIDLAGLRQLHQNDPTARAFLEAAAGRTYNQRETKVERAQQIVERTRPGTTRQEVVALFQALGNFGCGEFKVGRRGVPSRFAWSRSIISVGRAATNEDSEIESLATHDERSDEPAEEVLVHSYHLRPDLEAELQLPADLTKEEARRLASFVESLPFE